MSRLGPTGRLAALAMAVVLVFALAGSGVGTDARLGDSEVANVPVVVFGAAPDDQQSDLVGTPLTLTFEGLTAETADWPDGFTAVADDTGTASFSVLSTVSTTESDESNETAEPVYVVRLDSVGPDSVQFTLAGSEQTPATVAVNGDLLAGALGLSAFDPAVVELRIDGVVTGYDTTAAGSVQFQTLDWADRTVTFRAVESEVPVSDPTTETPTAPGEEPNSTTEAPTEDPNSTTEETPTEGPSGETPTETPTEEAPTEAPTEEAPTETPTEETPTEEAPTEEAPTEAPTEETPTETQTEAPTEDTPTETPTESSPTEESTESSSTETPTDETKTETESSEATETTEAGSSAAETTDSAGSGDSTDSSDSTDSTGSADTEASQTPDEAGE
ncbi:hypothetical protein [Salinirubrum litoreum]|uniref:Uncharacterized protein n=1 Tax=Salinirubrum litoreum TaxID=1126234 RepID=A0ABD5R9X7_9EURY|nr:hypothetical protein [Salinirubrum litoreum]